MPIFRGSEMSFGFSDAKSVILVLKNSLFTDVKELISSLNVCLHRFMVHHSKLAKSLIHILRCFCVYVLLSFSKQKHAEAHSTSFRSS